MELVLNGFQKTPDVQEKLQNKTNIEENRRNKIMITYLFLFLTHNTAIYVEGKFQMRTAFMSILTKVETKTKIKEDRKNV